MNAIKKTYPFSPLDKFYVMILQHDEITETEGEK
jgi:hypothetical protein